MAKLELLLLGIPQIYVDGQPVTDFNTRKDQALLAYLAVTGTTHSRETLAGLLWSELPEASARRNLRHALSHLQKVIGPQWLAMERGVALSREQPWSVDVQTLRSAVKSLTASPAVAAEHSGPQTLAALQQVVQLYRGEFMQGFYVQQAAAFEEWVLAQREESRLLTLHGLEALVKHCLAQGAYDTGLTATRRLLQLEPWSETAHCLQMQLLAQSGRRADALAQYERCRQVLAAELGVEPLPATTALYQQIQRGQANGVVASRVHQSPPATQRVTVNAPLPNNLLTPLAGFIGRQTELDMISQRLGTTGWRLLTIVGPGGMGKTSLAQAVAQRILQAKQAAFPDGIYFVTLTGLEPKENEDGEQVGALLATTIAERIGCDLQPGLPPQIQLQHYLRQRRLLLILDNFEHLLAATDLLLALSTQAPALTLLITSRARLNVRGETILALAKLSLPSPKELVSVEGGQESEAVAMFVQRAQYLDPYFTLNPETVGPVTQICRLVDGLPLGIELAASMLPLLSCTNLVKELTQSLAFLQAETRDLPVDQRTLQAVFDRSWRLLAPAEQTLLAKLAIWAGAFHWAAAQAVAEATMPVLLRLINQSLVNSTPDGRYTIHPSVRAFALEKLAQTPAQGDALRVYYARFYLDFLAQTEPALKGAALTTATAQIYTELDNIRLAWRWAITYRLYTHLLAALHGLFFFYDLQGLFTEAVEQIESSLQQFLASRAVQDPQDEPLLNVLIGCLQTYLGVLSLRLGHREKSDVAFGASLARLQQTDSLFSITFCQVAWGASLRGRDPQQSKTLLSEAVRQISAIDDGWLTAMAYLYLGEIDQLLGNYTEAMTHYTKGYSVAQQADCAWGVANGLRLLGRLQLALGHYPAAETSLQKAIACARQQNLKIIWLEASIHLGEAFRLQGRFDEAQQCYRQSRQEAEALHHTYRIGQALWHQGCLAEQRGEYGVAKALFTECMNTGHPNLWAHLLPTLGWALIGLDELDAAQRYFDNVLNQAQTHDFTPISLDAEVGLAYLALLQSDAAPSDRLDSVVAVFFLVYGHPAATQETRDRIVRLAAALGVPLPARQ